MDEEYISKSMLIEKLERIKPIHSAPDRYMSWLSYWNAVKEIPIVAGVIPIKTAKWLTPDKGFSTKIWRKCSNCGKHRALYHKHIRPTGEIIYIKEDYNYCPECGAKITGEQI